MRRHGGRTQTWWTQSDEALRADSLEPVCPHCGGTAADHYFHGWDGPEWLCPDEQAKRGPIFGWESGGF